MKALREIVGIGTKALDYLVNPTHGCSSVELNIRIISIRK